MSEHGPSAAVDDTGFDEFVVGVQRTLAAATATGARLFATDAAGLYDAFLDALPAQRQVHACAACRRFLDRHGGLVTIDPAGRTHSALWVAGAAPVFYRQAAQALRERVERATVTGVALSGESSWGKPQAGGWTHLAVPVPAPALLRSPLLTAEQATAARQQDHATITRALGAYSARHLRDAARILQAEALAQFERFLDPVRWLRDLQDARSRTRKPAAQANLVWRAVADAPAGYCHPRASMTGTLLEDLAAGLPFAQVQQRFNAKMHPLRFQRPQAAPTAATIRQAEELVERLGLGPALERRYARLEECEASWTPAASAAGASGGVFARVVPKEVAPGVELPNQTVTWEKFARTVLPGARAIDFLVPDGQRSFIALTSAVHADAPPILKWDRPERRNRVAWYVWPEGSPAAQWGLTAGTWCSVTAVVLLPPLWGDRPQPHLGQGAVLVLAGAVDGAANAGSALFPQNLIEPLHGMRAVIEAFSRKASLAGRDAATACGYDLRRGQAWDAVVRVHDADGWATYTLDRWD